MTSHRIPSRKATNPNSPRNRARLARSPLGEPPTIRGLGYAERAGAGILIRLILHGVVLNQKINKWADRHGERRAAERTASHKQAGCTRCNGTGVEPVQDRWGQFAGSRPCRARVTMKAPKAQPARPAAKPAPAPAKKTATKKPAPARKAAPAKKPAPAKATAAKQVPAARRPPAPKPNPHCPRCAAAGAVCPDCALRARARHTAEQAAAAARRARR